MPTLGQVNNAQAIETERAFKWLGGDWILLADLDRLAAR
jgi:hypothetical protein